MYSFGILPPVILSENSYPAPGSRGVRLITTSAYWPEPPVWRTNFSRMFSTGLPAVSRYATCGRPTFASTLNSRFSRSTMISRWSSPMPPISVWPVSSSDETRKVGSSSARRARPAPSLSWSAFDFGSTATWMTGSGKVIDSSTIGAFSAASVSPVVVFFRPTPAAISPAMISSRSSRWFACIWRMRPMRSVLPVVVFRTRSPALIFPE